MDEARSGKWAKRSADAPGTTLPLEPCQQAVTTARFWSLSPGLLLVLACLPAHSADDRLPRLTVDDPPAFGFQLGDVVQRSVHLRLPPGARLDSASLPPPTRHNAPVELSSVQHDEADDAARQTVVLTYQVFRSPPVPTVLELPALSLRFTLPQGAARREMTLRVDAHPLMVSPIAPAEPPNRAGLGPMQPDRPVPLTDPSPYAERLGLWAGVALLAAGWLAWRHAFRAIWARRQRPFASAWRDIRRQLSPGRSLDGPALEMAMRRLHAALRADAGRVLLAADLAAWLAERPRFAGLAGPLADFHAASERQFFARADNDRVAGDGPRSATGPATGGGTPSDHDASADRQAQARALAGLSQALARLEAAP
jgi:mxaA protein